MDIGIGIVIPAKTWHTISANIAHEVSMMAAIVSDSCVFDLLPEITLLFPFFYLFPNVSSQFTGE